MNKSKYHDEVKAMFGQEVVDTIENLLDSWFIIGFDKTHVTVGNKTENMSVSRKSGKVTSSYKFPKKKKKK